MSDRCIECGKPREAHAKDGACPWKYKTRYGSMNLPEGKTCNDCQHVRFCLQFLGTEVGSNTSCDWFPIRFAPKRCGELAEAEGAKA
jgi:hypothetical protein